MEAKIQQLAQEFKAELQKLYGERFDKLILYGSYARGDFHEDSDVDFLISLKDEEVKFGQEVRNISKKSGNLSLKYNITVSSVPISVDKLNNSTRFFFENVRREGVLI